MFYVYMVTCILTGQFYIGSRTNKSVTTINPEDDLWIRYFTSSKDVKQLIKNHGAESFRTSVLLTDLDVDRIYWHENLLISQNINHPSCINKFYVDRISGKKFSTAGTKTWTNGTGTYVKTRECPGEGWHEESFKKGAVWWENNGVWKHTRYSPGPKWTRSSPCSNTNYWNKDGIEVLSQESPGEGWTSGRTLQGQKMWHLNGRYTLSDTCPGPGWYPGHPCKGTTWWNDGKNELMTKECPGSNWVKGRLTFKNKWWTFDGKEVYQPSRPNPKWAPGRAKVYFWNNGKSQKMCASSPGIGWVRGRI